jgi:hypothetical protein
MKDSALAVFNWKDCLSYFGSEEALAVASLVEFKHELIQLRQQLNALSPHQLDQLFSCLKEDLISTAAYCGMPRLQAVLRNALCWVTCKAATINGEIRESLLQEITASLSALDKFLLHRCDPA